MHHAGGASDNRLGDHRTDAPATALVTCSPEFGYTRNHPGGRMARSFRLCSMQVAGAPRIATEGLHEEGQVQGAFDGEGGEGGQKRSATRR